MTAENGSRVLHEGISSEDKSLNIYEGLYHELFNEPEGPEIVQEVADWIKARV